MYDICIIGAGPSGLMASIAASLYGANTLVIDKNKQVGKKLRLTGGGRCNVTNRQPIDQLIQNIPGNGKFLYSALSQFNNEDIINFFEEHNTPLKEEDHGRMFPTTNKSKTIVDTLYTTAMKQNVTFALSTTVTKITEHASLFHIKTNDKTYTARKLIITTGGQTYTYTGSTGDGYQFAKQFGHHITQLYPTECPLISNDQLITSKTLQGLSFSDAQISILQKQKVILTHRHDLLFTHFGLSGPAALRCSGHIWQLLQKNQTVPIEINFYPDITSDMWLQKFQTYQQQNTKKQVSSMLKAELPERLAEVILQIAQIPKNTISQQLSKQQLMQIIQQLQHFKININQTWPLEKAFVTGGGIELKEINPKTMESKIQPHLFFAGEVLDINGYTGGFNITAAFATGYTAGSNAALSLYA